MTDNSKAIEAVKLLEDMYSMDIAEPEAMQSIKKALQPHDQETIDKVKTWFEYTKIYLDRKIDTDWSEDDEEIRKICIKAVEGK